MEYDAAGRLTKRTDPNGVVMTYSYDTVNRVLDVAASRGTTPIADYAYTRDTIGRVTTLAELGGRTVTYGYSQAGRLVNETITGEPHGINGSIAYTHDSVGNRLTRISSVGPVAGQAFSYDANDRITTESFDLNGNTLAAEGDAFGYDFEDRLVAINGTVGLSYDGDGNLASRSEAGVKTTYLVDELNPTGWSQVVEEVTGGIVSGWYSYGPEPLRLANGQSSVSYIADGGNDVRVLTDLSGAPVDGYDYDAFGTVVRGGLLPAYRIRSNGERVEKGNLVLLRARAMRVGTGRFMSEDSLEGSTELPGSLHRYVYANGDPENLCDPSGHYSMTEVMISVSIVTIQATLATAGVYAVAHVAVAAIRREDYCRDRAQKALEACLAQGHGDAFCGVVYRITLAKCLGGADEQKIPNPKWPPKKPKLPPNLGGLQCPSSSDGCPNPPQVCRLRTVALSLGDGS